MRVILRGVYTFYVLTYRYEQHCSSIDGHHINIL